MAGAELPPGAERWRWGDPTTRLRRVLESGGVLAIPTESSYGLGVDPRNREGVAAVFRLKGRHRGEALPVVAADLEQLAMLGIDVGEPRLRRLATVWPAPLSLIVPARPGLPAAAGGDTLAVRVPRHDRLLELLRRLGTPLTATSANLSGEPPVIEPAALAGLLAGAAGLIVDDGPLPGGAPSTMLALTGEQISVVRRGRYPMADLRRRFPELLGRSVRSDRRE